MSHLLAPIAWTLIHFCWQGAAVAALYGAASLMLARRSSQTRYLLALAALVAMLVCAAATFTWQLRRELTARAASVEPAALSAPLHNEFQEAMAPLLMREFAGTPAQSATLETGPALLAWIDGFWLLGVIGLSLRSLGGWWVISRLRTAGTTVVPEAVRAAFEALCAALGLRRPVRLAISEVVSGPLTVGFLRATVLLPLSAVTALGPDELKVVMAHELAHIRRADFLWNLVQTFAETVFFFHPAVWWIGGCLRAERELCCDDLALKLCPNPVVYASALFHLEEQRARRPHLAMALDGDGSRHTLRMRILRILGEPVMHGRGGPSRAFSLLIALAGVALLVLPTSQVLARLHPVHAAAMAAPVLQEAPAAPTPTPEAETAAPAPSAQEEKQEPSEPAPKPHAGTPAAPEAAPKSTYIDRMKAAGYDVDLDKYIAMKIQNVTPEYAREMAQAGFGKLSADDLIACKIQGVSPEAIREMRQQGLEITNIHDAISFRIFQVTPEFIAGMKAAGFSGLSSHQLIAMRVQGVTPEYARSITQQFPGATADDLVKAKIFHIDGPFIESARRLGFTNLGFDKLVKLRISGLLDEDK